MGRFSKTDRLQEGLLVLGFPTADGITFLLGERDGVFQQEREKPAISMGNNNTRPTGCLSNATINHRGI
jgi:hypothetical protein